MKIKQVDSLLAGIGSVADLPGVKFAYAMSKNAKALQKESEALSEARAKIDSDEKYVEFSNKREDLCKKYADRDDKDEPVMENIVKNQQGQMVSGNYVFNEENKKKFDKEVKKLIADSKDIMDARDEKIKEFNELLEKESEFVPFKVALSDVPEEITTKSLNTIIDLIQDDENL